MDDGWHLRNDVIWYKHKGGLSPSKDRFGSVYEDFFFFVKSDKYYFDADSIRTKPREAKVQNGAVVSATGVNGVRYKRQIELSTDLSDIEKENAMNALHNVLDRISKGEISDFRMVIRNVQRTTHSDSDKVSGRAKELKEKGYYFYSIILKEQCQVMFGILFLKIHKNEVNTTLHIPRNCVFIQ